MLRNVNDELAHGYVLVTDAKSSDLKNGAVVPKAAFDSEADRLKSLGLAPPEKQAPYPAASPGPANERLTLLPALQYTLPLLLIALTVWVAWRIVNYPAFADFLIATEAELNKVSWTTRPRLIQDTIVVLITTFLLAVFLFSMDELWRVVLSNWPINVLQINNEKIDKRRRAEDVVILMPDNPLTSEAEPAPPPTPPPAAAEEAAPHDVAPPEPEPITVHDATPMVAEPDEEAPPIPEPVAESPPEPPNPQSTGPRRPRRGRAGRRSPAGTGTAVALEGEEPAPEPSNKHWYVVKVQSGREETIKEAIERRVKIERLEEFFGQIIIPVERVTEMRNGKRVVKEQKLYPGYLMAEVEYNDRILYLFRETSGVGDFVGGTLNRPPPPMSQREIDKMMGTQGRAGGPRERHRPSRRWTAATGSGCATAPSPGWRAKSRRSWKPRTSAGGADDLRPAGAGRAGILASGSGLTSGDSPGEEEARRGPVAAPGRFPYASSLHPLGPVDGRIEEGTTMARQVTAQIRLQVPGGSATPAPPVGPALGQHGVNIGQFVSQFNDRTKEMKRHHHPGGHYRLLRPQLRVHRQEPAGRGAAQAGGRHPAGEEEGRRSHQRRGEDQAERQVQGLQGDGRPGAGHRQAEDPGPQRPRPGPRRPHHRGHGPQSGPRRRGVKRFITSSIAQR